MSVDEKNYRILWIEDQLDDLRDGVNLFKITLKARLNKELEVLEAGSLEKANEILEHKRKEELDLIILDAILPRTEAARKAVPPRVDMNAGFLFWYSIRKQKPMNDRFDSVPICVITARSKPVFREEMEKDENLLWLEKPIPPTEIIDKIFSKFLQRFTK